MERSGTLTEAESNQLLTKTSSADPVRDFEMSVGEIGLKIGDAKMEYQNIRKSRTSVGRSPNCDIKVEAGSVSNHHLNIYVSDSGNFTLEDVGSSHGTSVTMVEDNVIIPGGHGTLIKREVYKLAPGMRVYFGTYRTVWFEVTKTADPPKLGVQVPQVHSVDLAETQMIPELDDETPPAPVRGSKLADIIPAAASPTLASFIAAPQLGSSGSLGGTSDANNGTGASSAPKAQVDVDATLDFGYAAGGGANLPPTMMQDAEDLDATLVLPADGYAPDTTLAPTLIAPSGASPGTRPDDEDDDDIPPPLSNAGSRSAKMEAVLAPAEPEVKKRGPKIVASSSSDSDDDPPSPVVGVKRGRPVPTADEEKELAEDRPKAPSLRGSGMPTQAASSGSLGATLDVPEVVKPLPDGLRGGLRSSSSASKKEEESKKDEDVDEEDDVPKPVAGGKREPAPPTKSADAAAETKTASPAKRAPAKTTPKKDESDKEDDAEDEAPLKDGIRGGGDSEKKPVAKRGPPAAATPTSAAKRAPKVATPPAAPTPPAKVRWQYKSDLRKNDKKDEAWTDYSDGDGAFIEAGYQLFKAAKSKTKKVSELKMPGKTYICYFKEKPMVQARADDFDRQRPIRRLE